MNVKEITLCLFSFSFIAHGAADDAAKIALLDCFDRKTMAISGVSTNRTWIAHHKVCKIADMSHDDKEFLIEQDSITSDTTKLLRCCVGYVEGQSSEQVGKAVAAIAQDLHPQNHVWEHPFDFRGRLNLRLFIPDADMTEQVKDMDATLRWFRCTDDSTLPYQNNAQEGICALDSFMLPNSFEESIFGMVMSLAESNEVSRQPLELMLQKKAMTPEVIASVDTYVRSRGNFHEASYLVLNSEKFAAFVAQEFGS